MNIARELWRLAEEGDERAIKRAYARGLKQTRPDEDPVAFQQLQEAYQRALARCASITAVAGDDGPELAAWEPSPALPSAEHTAEPKEQLHDVLDAAPVFTRHAKHPGNHTDAASLEDLELELPAQPNPYEVSARLLAQAVEAEPLTFVSALREQRSSWSLDTREVIAVQVLQALREHRAPMNRPISTMLYQAFGWDEVACGIDPQELRWLADRAYQVWMQLPAQKRALSVAMGTRAGGKQLTPAQVAARVQLLQQPRPHLRNLLASVPHGRIAELIVLMNILGCYPGLPLPPGIDPTQATFWANVPDRLHRFGVQRSLLRAGLAGLMLAALALLMNITPLLSALLPGLQPGPRILVALAVALLAPLALTLGLIGLRFLTAWQCEPEDAPLRWPALRLLAVPLLALAIGGTFALAFWHLRLNWFSLSFLLAILSGFLIVTARARYQARRGRFAEMNVVFAAIIFFASLSVLPGLVIALLFWATDLFHNRRKLRWSATA